MIFGTIYFTVVNISLWRKVFGCTFDVDGFLCSILYVMVDVESKD